MMGQGDLIIVGAVFIVIAAIMSVMKGLDMLCALDCTPVSR